MRRGMESVVASGRVAGRRKTLRKNVFVVGITVARQHFD